jgi:hypothetical protein
MSSLVTIGGRMYLERSYLDEVSLEKIPKLLEHQRLSVPHDTVILKVSSIAEQGPVVG